MAFTREQLTAAQSAALLFAEDSLDKVYAPYSKIQVAAALVFPKAAPIIGTNYESASYGLTLCAERAAIAAAQTAGLARNVTALVLVARTARKREGLLLTPCGACRQWIVELANRCNRDFPVFCFAFHQSGGKMFNASQLLPDDFSLPADS